MPDQIDISELAAMVRQRRGDQGLRKTAIEIGGVSAATLSRIEQGKVPDFHTYLRICGWLGIQPATKMSMHSSDATGTVDKLAAHLRADRNLTPESALALERLIRQAYETLSGGKRATE